jgi:uncharacterized protein YciI
VILRAHWDDLRRLHTEGKAVVTGPPWTGEDPFGIGVLDVREREEVETILAADPAITSGALRAEIRPFRIVTR